MTKPQRFQLDRTQPSQEGWWTEDRLIAVRRMLVEEGQGPQAIGRKLGVSKETIQGKAKRMGWDVERGITGREAYDITNRVANGPGTGKPRISQALPGSEPRPYYTHRDGECGFILGDEEGSMSDALTCCLPTDGRYCAEHQKLSYNAPKPGRPRNAKELTRSLKAYL